MLKSLKNKVLLARQFLFSEWLILIEAWWLLLGFYLALRWLSYGRLNKLMPSAIGEGLTSSSRLAYAERLKHLVEISSRLHLLHITCLVKSFALRWMLTRRGISVQLCIGIGKTSSEVHAHAWVEMAGVPIGEAADVADRFKILGSVEQVLPSDFDAPVI
ncbi:MAG: lasso peptide biosynthesis B2 protein [Chloroflexi bacterium]|nr:lasso peptide biosynthesis B2 protein [Chloroflexota bacterium]